MNHTSILEPIDIGPDYRQRYLAALRSGRDQFACDVSGYTAERVKMDRARVNAGYDIFTPIDRSFPKAAKDGQKPRSGRKSHVNCPASFADQTWARDISARMDAANLRNIDLAQLTKYSESWVSAARNARYAINPDRKSIISAALSSYENLRALTMVAA